MRKIQAHQPLVWPHQSLVDLQVGGTAAQALHIDTPFLGIQAECLEGTSLAGQLNGVNVLVASVVSSSWITLGVFVGHGRAKGIENGPRGEVLRGDEDDGFTLALDFPFLFKSVSTGNEV
jgi:UDP-N-acetylglucosamine:LPS N-acetylglucosamine transferase